MDRCVNDIAAVSFRSTTSDSVSVFVYALNSGNENHLCAYKNTISSSCFMVFIPISFSSASEISHFDHKDTCINSSTISFGRRNYSKPRNDPILKVL